LSFVNTEELLKTIHMVDTNFDDLEHELRCKFSDV